MQPAKPIRFGPYQVDVRAGELRKFGSRIPLQDQSLQILLLLLERPGGVVLREDIQLRLWPNHTIVGYDHSINTAVRRLRAALGESADTPRYIETVAKRGYRFIGELEAPEEVSPPAANAAPRYRLFEKLGQGGMGVVYRGEDIRLGRQVAVKLLGTDRVTEPGLQQLEREARTASLVNHPHICTIYGLEEFESGPGIVMELVDGETLAARIARGPLPVPEALPIAIQVASALAEAHRRGIVHRDLKPSNIMLTKHGAKVLDFGLAKMDSATAGSFSGIAGTLHYLSPEQIQGELVDWRSDIFSLGMVLYEILSGRRAFESDSAGGLMARIRERDPAPLNSIPPAIGGVVVRCLAKDRRARWQSAGELQIELERLARTPVEATSQPITAPSRQQISRRGWRVLFSRVPKIPPQIRRLLRRCLERHPKQKVGDTGEAKPLLEAEPRRLLPWAVTAVVTTVLGALAFVHFREAPALLQLTRFSVDLGPDAIARSRITAAISPDGRRLAFVGRGRDGKLQLATRLLDQVNPTLLPGTEGATDPFFSPDNQWIGFFADGRMKKISVEGGAAVALCDAPNARGASWGEDGNIIFTPNTTGGTGLSRVSDLGGTPQTLTQPADTNELIHRWPQILPGGQAVLFTGTDLPLDFDNGSIDVLVLRTGKVKKVARGGYFGRYMPLSDHSGELVYIHQGTLLGLPFDLEKVEAHGTPVPLQQDLASDPFTGGGQFDFSRNGTFVYLSGKPASSGWPLMWLDSSGKTEPLLAASGPNYGPRFSPDGRRLAFFALGIGLETYDWERGATNRVDFSSANQVQGPPVWTPDGKHLVFRTENPANSLKWIRSDGAGEAQQLMEGKSELRPYSFSPDSRLLAFSQTDEHVRHAGDPTPLQTGFKIWTLPLDLRDPEHPKAGAPQQFQTGASNVDEPAFSPDGHWIAYRYLQGGSDLYVQPFPGPGGKWLIGAGRHPVWSRNRRELFYFDNASGRIIVTAYTTKGNSFLPEKSHAWSEAQLLEPSIYVANMDVAPDAKRFVVSPRREDVRSQQGSVHVTVLLNYFDELRRKAPAR